MLPIAIQSYVHSELIDLELPEYEKYDIKLDVRSIARDAVNSARAASGGSMFQCSPITALYDQFSKEGKANREYAKLLRRDKYTAFLAAKYNKNIVSKFTGITDEDRALTISEFAKLAGKIRGLSQIESQRLFGQKFRAPGHVFLCNSSQRPLENRFGHTELGVALMIMADLFPIAVGCEMMTKKCALPKEKAIEYANENNLIFIEGKDIIEAWKSAKS